MSRLSVYSQSLPEQPNKVLCHADDIARTLAEVGADNLARVVVLTGADAVVSEPADISDADYATWCLRFCEEQILSSLTATRTESFCFSMYRSIHGQVIRFLIIRRREFTLDV